MLTAYLTHWTFDRFIELTATTSGLICVYLAARENIWNFFFGLINASTFFLLFHHQKLYADMCLHFIYIGFQVYGFYEWRFGGKKHHGVFVVSASAKKLFYAALAIAFIALIEAYVLKNFTDSTAIALDATTTAMSLVAYWMMANKWIENWYLWILMNFFSIAMMSVKGLYMSMALYGIYTIFCLMGIKTWYGHLKALKATAGAKAVHA